MATSTCLLILGIAVVALVLLFASHIVLGLLHLVFSLLHLLLRWPLLLAFVLLAVGLWVMFGR